MSDDEEMPEEEEDHESYFNRRGREFEEHDEAMKERAAAPETEDEVREVLNRDDEVLDEPSWNQVYHEVVVRFRWSDMCRYTESAMESIETVDGDPIGTAIDAYLQPMYEDDTFEVIEKSHRVHYESDD